MLEMTSSPASLRRPSPSIPSSSKELIVRVKAHRLTKLNSLTVSAAETRPSFRYFYLTVTSLDGSPEARCFVPSPSGVSLVGIGATGSPSIAGQFVRGAARRGESARHACVTAR